MGDKFVGWAALTQLVTEIKTRIAGRIAASEKGASNGVATLDATGRVPYTQLPESAMEFKGVWDASTNNPTLKDGTGTNGDFYVCNVAGTVNFGTSGSPRNVTFYANDRALYDGGAGQWIRLPASEVRTVNGMAGDVTITTVEQANKVLFNQPLATSSYPVALCDEFAPSVQSGYAKMMRPMSSITVSMLDGTLSAPGFNGPLSGTASYATRLGNSTNSFTYSELIDALAAKADSSSLATVATSGSYSDLSNKPTIPAAQVNSDWNATTGVAKILNKPSLATVATSGSYSDLSNKPTNATTSAAGFMSAADKTKLDGIATGAQVNTVTGVKGNSETNYRTGNINITKSNIGLGSVVNTGDSATPVSGGTTKFTTGGAYTELAKKVDTTRTVNGKALSTDISLTASDVGAATSADITTAINALDVSTVGGDAKYIAAIYETNGKITATAKDVAQTYSSTGTAAICGKGVAAALGTLDVNAVGGAGKYISAISETDGKISATATTMDTAPTANSTNAVTSGGVKSAIDTAESNAKNLANATETLAVSHGGTGQTTAVAAETSLTAAVYFSSSTAAGTVTKEVTASAAPNTVGARFVLHVTTTNTVDNPVLKVNVNSDYYSYTLRYHGSALGKSYLSSGRYLEFMVLTAATKNGANGVAELIGDLDTNTTYIGMVDAYCSTEASEPAKVASGTNVSTLKGGSLILVRIVNANTSKTALTFNCGGTGAKTLYINGSTSSASNYTLPAGTYMFYWDGTYWYVRTDGKLVIPNFNASGSTAAPGLVPAPSTTAGTSKYLCEDGTWSIVGEAGVAGIANRIRISAPSSPVAGDIWIG